MARMIDADTLRSNIDCCDIETYNDKLTIIEQINEAPTVDAVEVVRCRECKHRYNGKDCTHPLLLSYSFGAIRNVKDNDFCSYGERKDVDGNG